MDVGKAGYYLLRVPYVLLDCQLLRVTYFLLVPYDRVYWYRKYRTIVGTVPY